jgi:WS/DGAT/MGAT family acyltransferase
MIHVLLSMTDTTPDAFIKRGLAAPALAMDDYDHDQATDEGTSDIFRRLFNPVTEAVAGAVKAGRDLFETVEEGVEEIARLPAQTLSYARQGLGLATEAGHLLLLADDMPTRFRGKQGVAKRVAWAEPLPLPEVRTVGKALGCTVNDVLLSCAAGALRDYLVEKGDPVDPRLEIRATVPVNLRPLEQANRLGNVFGMVLLTLPIGIENPLERLFELRRRMGELKGSYQAMLALGLLGLLGAGPSIVQASAIRMLTRKASAVVTNVPGPQYPIYWAGARIGEMMFWVPQSGTIGMGISILSYNNRVHFGLVTDFKIIKDPESIIRRFHSEFEKLLLITMMGPWDRQLDPGVMQDTIVALRSGASNK